MEHQKPLSIQYVGDCGTDTYLDHNVVLPGGISLNGAIHARKNYPSKDTITVLTALGNDSNADIVLNTLVQNGIKNIIATLPGQTPNQDISHTSTGEKVFIKYNAGILPGFQLTNLQQQKLATADLVMTVYFEQIHKLFESVLSCNKQHDCVTAVDFMDLGNNQKNISILKQYIDRYDIAFIGLELAHHQDIINQIQKIAQSTGKLFIVTLGENGSIAFTENETCIQNAITVSKVIDTTGAGDAFAAVFLKNYMYAQNIPTALLDSSKYAAKIITKVGTF